MSFRLQRKLAQHYGMDVRSRGPISKPTYDKFWVNEKIVELCEEYEFSIPSLTGDLFHAVTFWKATDSTVYKELTDDFEAIITSCANINIKLVVVPLVDNGSIENSQQENINRLHVRPRNDIEKSLTSNGF